MGLNRKERETWRQADEEVSIPTVKEKTKAGEEFEYLFWVGSMGSYDNRSQKIALSFAKLMNEAGISFAILGNKEKNSGDTPRRLGNEFVFQEMATKNIEEFEKAGVKKSSRLIHMHITHLKMSIRTLAYKQKSIIIQNY